MGHEVFVSHSSKDQPAADALVAHLERNGIGCWVAPRDVVPGPNLAGTILKAIADAKLMVLIFSGNANAARHIRRVVERAVDQGIGVVSVRIADVAPADDLEHLLKTARWFDASRPPMEDHLSALTETIRTLLHPGVAPSVIAVPAVAPPTIVPPQVIAPKAVPQLVVNRPLAAASSAASIPPTPGAMPSPTSSRRIWPWLAGSAVIAASVVLGIIAFRREHSSTTPNARIAPTTPVALAQPAFLSPSASREQRLELLRQLTLNSQLTADEVQLATQLLNAPPPALSAYDSARLAQINNALEGRLPCDKLGSALDAIETPEQQQQRIAREKAAKKAVARQARIEELLATARANDNEDHDKTALAALDALLQLDPGNAVALQLREKISQYAPAKQYRLEQEAAARAAAEKQMKIGSLLATAAADEKSGHGADGLAALDELLKLDPQNAAALALHGTISNELKITNSLGMSFAYISPGKFLMGSPVDEAGRSDDEIQHAVVLTRSFFMAATLVTQAQWEAVMGSRPGNFQGDNLPVEQVSYDEAAEFCRKLGNKEGKHYRLPTEAEWEYACRAGTSWTYNTGSDEAALAEAGWYAANSGDQTHPVGRKKPNAWGLYDMQGNVWEWCNDWYGPYDKGETTDPHGSDTVRDRVLRGGSWHDPAPRCRCARRRYSAPDARYYSIGFRVVMDAG